MWLQLGDRGSVTVTSPSVVLPEFVTVILKVAVPPLATVWLFGALMIEIDGRGFGFGFGCGCGFGFGFGFGAGVEGGVIALVTATGAVSVAVTWSPFGAVPVTVATFVKPAVTFESAQL